MRREPLIIGGGPAGTAAAISLALAGHQPRLIERSSGPTDKVCGDFLGADAIERLRDLGVDPMHLGALPIRRLRLVHRDRVAEADLPFPAVGLSRRVLDEALLHRAAAIGARVHLSQGVRRIVRKPDGWLVHIADGDPIAADTVFLATGKHDLRDLPRPGIERGAIGMKMYFHLAPEQSATSRGVIALILFPDGYAGLQCVEADRAVLCIAVRRGRFQASGGTWSGLLAALMSASPYLDRMLAGSTPLLPRPLAIAGVPYGFQHRERTASRSDWRQDGLFRLGDQVAVIPSLTGDGIAIALDSGSLAAQLWQKGFDAVSYHNHLTSKLGGQMRLAGLLHGAAMSGPLQAAAIRSAAWFPGLLRQASNSTRVGMRTSIVAHCDFEESPGGKAVRPSVNAALR